jgi:hypothetical protein
VSESGQNGSSPRARTLPCDPHEDFPELCALSTTGELTAEEKTRLNAHLAYCDACRQLLDQYERMVAMQIPALAAESYREQDEENGPPGSWSIEHAEATLMESLRSETYSAQTSPVLLSKPFIGKRGWKYPLAAAILGAFSLAFYQAGRMEGRVSVALVIPAAQSAARAASPANPGPSATDSAQAGKTVSEDDQIVQLRHQLRQGEQERAGLNERLGQLKDELTKLSSDLNESREQRVELSRELTQAQADARNLQTKLDAIGNQTSEDTAQLLADKIKLDNLSRALEGKDNQIAQEQELLEHDHDIRNVIGARNLYIAEIYDVGKSGDTEKPFGRVFYTKDRLLIFYGYDLDQQRGLKKDTSFQAWGRGGLDGKHDVSLGLLYQDDSGKKRWVLKFNDPKTISKLDAFFITAEPEGGSVRPTGKPLLFTYLRLDPNHP